MNWLERLERKFGRKAIPNITRVFVVTTLIGYVLSWMSSADNLSANILLNIFAFSPAHILRGEVWRLITWIFCTSDSSFWNLIFLLCLWMLGNNLEYYLGSFKMNFYFVSGIILYDVAGMLIYVITGVPIYITMYFILFSLYLMLGLFMPEAEVRLNFVLPVKMKWLMLVYFLMLGYDVYSYFKMGVGIGIAFGSQIVLAIINLLVFFILCRSRLSFKQKKRQVQYRRQVVEPRPGSGITRHKCCICGRTEEDDPGLMFRYCSKCAGSKEYCQDHLFTHTHARPM